MLCNLKMFSNTTMISLSTGSNSTNNLHIRDNFPDMATGPYAEIVPPYFQHMILLMVEKLLPGDLIVGSLRKVGVYNFFSSS